MFDNDFYKRILDLSCNEEDLKQSVDEIKYDLEDVFEKYYNVSIICNAIDMFLNHKWSDSTLSSWSYRYMYILYKDFDNDLKDNLLQFFIKDKIIDLLDSLTIVSYEYFDDENPLTNYLEEFKELFMNLDIVYNSISEWIGYYTKTNADDEGYYLLLINHLKKQYLLLDTTIFEDGYEDENFVSVSKKEHLNILVKLQKQGYQLLHYDEKWYYLEVYEV